MAKGKGAGRGSPKTTTRTRSSVDGRFKPNGWEKTHPNTSVVERVPLPGHGANKGMGLQPPKPFPKPKPKTTGKQ